MAKRTQASFSIGVDYGTSSVRAIVVDVRNGRELATHVFAYPTGKDGIILDRRDPNLARQNPADYIKGFVATVGGAVEQAMTVRGFSPESVVGIGVDTTGSTPIPVDATGRPLSMTRAFRKHPAAQAWLWKDHTSHEEAAEITATARKSGVPYLAKCGGTYSSEWFWSKILHCERTAPDVFAAAHSWVEACDFVPAYVTGTLDPSTMKRSICAAGHKAMFSESWGGLPEKRFLRKLSPGLSALRERLYTEAVPSDHMAGQLTPSVAAKVGLPAGIPVTVGAFDAHHGAVGAGVGPGTLVKILGTSTCDMMVVPGSKEVADIPGVCGIVPGSVVPGMTGVEAGQSAVGDIFKWYVDYIAPGAYAHGDPYANLAREASRLTPGESGLMALDWNNGNRNVLVDPLLTGLLVGQTLHTTGAEIYRALVEATAFGAATVIRRIEDYGVPVKRVITCGGLVEKSPFLMQAYADVCNRPMMISRSAQTCALGAAVFGAVVGRSYRTTRAAQRAMTGVKAKSYRPIKANAAIYEELYGIYRRLHDGFGVQGSGESMAGVMKELIAIRHRVRKG